MGLFSWWREKPKTPVVYVRQSKEVGQATVTVEFDDKTVAQVKLTGAWSYWDGFNMIIMWTGRKRADQFIEDKHPIPVGNGYSYPRHRVSRYHTELSLYESLQDDKSTIDIVWPIPLIGES